MGGDPFTCGLTRLTPFFLLFISIFYIVLVFFSLKFKESKKVPVYLFISYFLLVLIICVVPIWIDSGYIQSIVKGTSTECYIYEDNSGDKCYAQLALTKANSSYCKKIKERGINSQCFASFVSSNETINLCDGSNFPTNCRYLVAINTSNPKICNTINIKYVNQECLGELAQKLNKKDLCPKTYSSEYCDKK